MWPAERYKSSFPEGACFYAFVFSLDLAMWLRFDVVPFYGLFLKHVSGCHNVDSATTFQKVTNARWFFATPQVCFETQLLRMALLLAARGGVSWTAFFVVYFSLWGSTMTGTMYSDRAHFLKVLEVAAA